MSKNTGQPSENSNDSIYIVTNMESLNSPKLELSVFYAKYIFIFIWFPSNEVGCCFFPFESQWNPPL